MLVRVLKIVSRLVSVIREMYVVVVVPEWLIMLVVVVGTEMEVV